jgi:hypothetical protein
LGLGAPLPKTLEDGSWNRTELRSNDKLREQLLGRNIGKSPRRQLPTPHRPLGEKGQTQSCTPCSNSKVESDDDGGRSSLGRSKRKRTVDEDCTTVGDKIADGVKTPAATQNASGKKIGSYLDEILIERSKKKPKKKANLDNITRP